jgi:hypothetical protein
MHEPFEMTVADRHIRLAKRMQEDFNAIKISNKRKNGPHDWHGVLGEIMFDIYMKYVENKVNTPIDYEWIEFVTTDTASADFEFHDGRTRTDVKTTAGQGLYFQPSNLKFDYYIKMTPTDFLNGDKQKPQKMLIAGYLSKQEMEKLSREIVAGNTNKGQVRDTTGNTVTHMIYEHHLRPIEELMDILRG